MQLHDSEWTNTGKTFRQWSSTNKFLYFLTGNSICHSLFTLYWADVHIDAANLWECITTPIKQNNFSYSFKNKVSTTLPPPSESVMGFIYGVCQSFIPILQELLSHILINKVWVKTENSDNNASIVIGQHQHYLPRPHTHTPLKCKFDKAYLWCMLKFPCFYYQYYLSHN